MKEENKMIRFRDPGDEQPNENDWPEAA